MKILTLKNKTQVVLNNTESKILETLFALPKREWPDKIQLAGSYYDKSNIGDLINIEESEQNLSYKEIMKEYYANRKSFLALTAPEKAQHSISYLKCFLMGFTGLLTPVETIIEDHMSDIIKWFEQNPTRTVISLKWLSRLFKEHYKPTADLCQSQWRKAVLSYCERSEIQDIVTQKEDIEWNNKLASNYM